MKRTHLAVAAALALLAGILVYVFVIRGDGDGSAKAGADRGSDRGRGGGMIDGRDAGAGGGDIMAEAAPTIDLPDPEGPLRLEGQVLGEDDQPVGGAEVWITSNPARSATSEDDGSFAFEKLLPREYSVSATAGDLIGGPVTYTLGPDAGPLVVRLREGASLRVKVIDEATGTPVVGAKVELQEMGGKTATTDNDGVATFRAMAAGWSQVQVRAIGFAPASGTTTIGAAGSNQELTVALRKGAGVAGKVVDEAGAPVANAMVTLQVAASAWSPDADVTSSAADGTWSFSVVSAGSYTVAARDAAHAPAVSDIITVDGANPQRDVTIVLRSGGTIRGRVVTATKQPAPFASVKVSPKQTSQAAYWDWGGGGNQVTADDQGRFELRGLPRTQVRARAESDQAASAIVDVDLLASATVEDLELVLDVQGTIAGVVVDAAGEPVAEAQVSAMPDWMSAADGDMTMEDMQFAGFTAATTDGGGAFRLHGLPTGKFRLWASRTQQTSNMMFATKGTPARTGDAAVRIVLPAPGGVEAQLAFADGSTPTLAMVQVGVMPSSPVRDGEVLVRDLPPGKYDFKVRGADFAEKIQRDVLVEAGKITDLGTVTIKRGRRVAGKVVDASGNGVEGARVVVGEILFSEGSSDHNQAIEEQMGMRSAITAADGSFNIQGAPEKGGKVIAEHPEHGRSDAGEVPPGEHDVLELRMALHGFGSVTGRVTMEGEPVANAQLMASAKGSSGHVVVVATGPDGRFVIDKIPEGDHRLTATRMMNMQMSSAGADVTVKAGERTDVELKIPVGTITLTVEVKGKNDVHIDAAQVFLFRNSIAARNAKEITDRFLAGDGAGMGFWMGGATFPSFDKLVAGSYTVCTLPVNGDLSDLQFQQRLQENMELLMVYCQSKTLQPSPDKQTHVAVVPAMTPLPAIP